MTSLRIKLVNSSAIAPKRASEGAAGYDIHSLEDCVIEAWSRKLVSTGIHIAINKGYYVRIAPRSGMTVKGIDVGAGVIDCDYRGQTVQINRGWQIVVGVENKLGK